MTQATEITISAIVIGAGATAGMDLWAAFLRRCFGVSSLDYALLGRWIGHFPRGQFAHESIGKAAPVRHERIIGWSAHYAIGIMFAAALLAVWGLEWARRPTLAPALIISVVTLVAPLRPAAGNGRRNRGIEDAASQHRAATEYCDAYGLRYRSLCLGVAEGASHILSNARSTERINTGWEGPTFRSALRFCQPFNIRAWHDLSMAS